MIVYAYMRNDCIYESAAAPVSLHTTKAGAWRAMHTDLFQRWQKERDDVARYGRFGTHKGSKIMQHEAHFIEAMPVLGDPQ